VGERLFNEKEVREILKKASSIRSSGGGINSDGISLEELKQTGGELGLDPAHIELAAQQLGSEPASGGGFFGARMVLDRTIEGEVTPDDWLGMVAVLQRHHKGAGAVTQRGFSYDWAGSDEGASMAVTVNAKNGRSRIRLESNRWMGVMMASVFCPVFCVVFSFVVHKNVGTYAVPLVWLLFATLYYSFIRFYRQHHAESVASLMERMVSEVGTKNSDLNIEEAPVRIAASAQEQSIKA